MSCSRSHYTIFWYNSGVKRLLETVIVLLAAPLWLPLVMIVAVVVRLTEGAPVMFRQERAGLRGKPFVMLKFRTMRPGNGSDAERMTRLGRFLRSTSLDELPQLFHVLTGKMSLVGPRPLPTAYLPRYTPEQARRHEVRPGITGWAQVNGRNAISWEEKFRHDVWYVDNHTLLLDIRILFKTVFKTASRKGINQSSEETMEEFLG